MEDLKKADGIFSNAEFNRFGLISAILLIVGCLGGLTVGMGAVEHILDACLNCCPNHDDTFFTVSSSTNEIHYHKWNNSSLY